MGSQDAEQHLPALAVLRAIGQQGCPSHHCQPQLLGYETAQSFPGVSCDVFTPAGNSEPDTSASAKGKQGCWETRKHLTELPPSDAGMETRARRGDGKGRVRP